MTEARASDLGLDIGGTWVKACIVEGLPGERRATRRAERAWGGFEAITLERQLAGEERGGEERAAAARLVKAAVEVVAEALDGDRLGAFGVASAGPKTGDGRGIALWRRGPRAPQLLDELLAGLAERELVPEAAAVRMIDDSVAALRGERTAAEGALTGSGPALWLGPGTDLGEAWLHGGQAGPRPGGVPAPWDLVDDGDRAQRSFAETCRIAPGLDLPAAFAALGRLARARLAAGREGGLEAPRLLVVGARGGQLLAESPGLRAALDAGLAGALPWRASILRSAAAIGALG